MEPRFSTISMALSLLALAVGPMLTGCVGREGAGYDRGYGYGEGVRYERGEYQHDELRGDHFWRREGLAHNHE
jgi:hypothetical protein